MFAVQPPGLIANWLCGVHAPGTIVLRSPVPPGAVALGLDELEGLGLVLGGAGVLLTVGVGVPEFVIGLGAPPWLPARANAKPAEAPISATAITPAANCLRTVRCRPLRRAASAPAGLVDVDADCAISDSRSWKLSGIVLLLSGFDVVDGPRMTSPGWRLGELGHVRRHGFTPSSQPPLDGSGRGGGLVRDLVDREADQVVQHDRPALIGGDPAQRGHQRQVIGIEPGQLCPARLLVAVRQQAVLRLAPRG